jgi:hypothetical protein
VDSVTWWYVHEKYRGGIDSAALRATLVQAREFEVVLDLPSQGYRFEWRLDPKHAQLEFAKAPSAFMAFGRPPWEVVSAIGGNDVCN